MVRTRVGCAVTESSMCTSAIAAGAGHFLNDPRLWAMRCRVKSPKSPPDQ